MKLKNCLACDKELNKWQFKWCRNCSSGATKDPRKILSRKQRETQRHMVKYYSDRFYEAKGRISFETFKNQINSLI